MTKKLTIGICFVSLFILFLIIDRTFFMKTRIHNSLWVCDRGDYRKIGAPGFIDKDLYLFVKDTMILYNGNKLKLKYQYFNQLILVDVETKEKLVYSRKGESRLIF